MNIVALYKENILQLRFFARKCLILQLLTLIFLKLIISDMHCRITYMYTNFQRIRVYDQSIQYTQISLQKYRKLHNICKLQLHFFIITLFLICTTPQPIFRPNLKSIDWLKINLPRQ